MIIRITIPPIDNTETCVYWFRASKARCGEHALGQINDRWLCGAHLLKKLRDIAAEE